MINIKFILGIFIKKTVGVFYNNFLHKNMCIVFIYNGKDDVKSDYRFILVSNRDEYYNRPAQPLDPWTENPNVYGGMGLIFAISVSQFSYF